MGLVIQDDDEPPLDKWKKIYICILINYFFSMYYLNRKTMFLVLLLKKMWIPQFISELFVNISRALKDGKYLL